MNNGPLTSLYQPVRYTSVLMTALHSSNGKLVGGFNPSEKYESNWKSFPNRDENNKYLKPPPRKRILLQDIVHALYLLQDLHILDTRSSCSEAGRSTTRIFHSIEDPTWNTSQRITLILRFAWDAWKKKMILPKRGRFATLKSKKST